jgi:cytochrome c-type biogenesis protein CcmE
MATGMDKATSRQLKELGFELSEEGKHWKLVYNGVIPDTFSYILPKTGSDYRRDL